MVTIPKTFKWIINGLKYQCIITVCIYHANRSIKNKLVDQIHNKMLQMTSEIHNILHFQTSNKQLELDTIHSIHS